MDFGTIQKFTCEKIGQFCPAPAPVPPTRFEVISSAVKGFGTKALSYCTGRNVAIVAAVAAVVGGAVFAVKKYGFPKFGKMPSFSARVVSGPSVETQKQTSAKKPSVIARLFGYK